METMKVRIIQEDNMKEVIINETQYALISWMYDNGFSEGFSCEVLTTTLPEDISKGY